jgi:hypothetical protein
MTPYFGHVAGFSGAVFTATIIDLALAPINDTFGSFAGGRIAIRSLLGRHTKGRSSATAPDSRQPDTTAHRLKEESRPTVRLRGSRETCRYRIVIKQFPLFVMFDKLARPGQPFDIA